MSKAIEGAVLIAAGIVLEFVPGGQLIGTLLIINGATLEVAALAALFSTQGSGYTVRQPAPFRQVIYGVQRVGGIFAYMSTTGSHVDQNNFIIVLAGHEVEAIENLYLDGRQVHWDAGSVGHTTRNGVSFGGSADGGTYTGPGGAQYNFGTLVYCEPRFGDQTDTSAGPDFPGGTASVIGGMTANDPNWAASGGRAPTLRGCAYVYLKLEYDAAMFPNTPGGVEIKFTVRGKRDIWDPRTNTKGYTSNAALICADVIRDTTYGIADVDSFKDAASVAQLVAAANICDESVFVEATQSNEARYACHYHYESSAAPGDALAAMLQSMGGRISMIGGEWYLFPAAWTGPSFTFDENVLAGPLEWSPVRSQKDLCNRVTGTYIAPTYPYNTAGNLYDANGFYNGGIQNNFPFAFEPASIPMYAQDVQHGYTEDLNLEEDSQLLGPWDSMTMWSLGDVVSYSGVMYKSLSQGNTGNQPDTSSVAYGSSPAAYAGGTTYSIGAVVTDAGVTYTSLQSANTGNTPASSPTWWQVGVAPPVWSSATTYSSGDAVTFNGQVYVSVAGSNLNNSPDTSPLDWQLFQCWAAYANLLTKELTLRSVLSVSQAQRLLKIELMRNRKQGSGVLRMMQQAFAMQCQDVMSFSFGAMGWSGKVLEIMGMTGAIEYGDGRSAPRETLELAVQESGPEVYDWNGAAEEMDPYDKPAAGGTSYSGFPVSPPAIPYVIAAPTSLAVSAAGLVTWTAPADARVTQVQVQYSLHGAAMWLSGPTVAVPTAQGQLSGLALGQSYDVRVRSFASLTGAVSAWVELDNTTITQNSAPVASYSNNPAISLTQPTSTTIHVDATSVTFGGQTVNYAARTLTISAPSVPTWYYVTIADSTQQGESGSPTLTATASTSDALAGVQGNTYMGAVLALPAGSAVSALAGGWPAPQTVQVI
jgi:hypothetical protein